MVVSARTGAGIDKLLAELDQLLPRKHREMTVTLPYGRGDLVSRAHREVLTETILRNRTVNEAAEILGVPLGTVKTRVYYALRALRIVLDERGAAT